MPKDLNMVRHIPEMIKLGVNSFKIEGRMRSIYYIATVLHTYKQIFEKIRTNSLTDEYIYYACSIINRVANRESTPQFFEGLPGVNEQYFCGRKEESNQDFLGLVLDSSENAVTLEVRNYFKVGDVVQIFGPKMETIEFKLEDITNEDGEKLDFCNQPKSIVKIKVPAICDKYSMMRVKVFDIFK